MAYTVVVKNWRRNLPWINCFNDHLHLLEARFLVLFFRNQSVIWYDKVVESSLGKFKKLFFNFSIQDNPLLCRFISQKALKNAKFFVSFLNFLLFRFIIFVRLLLLLFFILAIWFYYVIEWVSVWIKLNGFELVRILLWKSMNFFKEWYHFGLTRK